MKSYLSQCYGNAMVSKDLSTERKKRKEKKKQCHVKAKLQKKGNLRTTSIVCARRERERQR